ncbi:MAG: D-alanine--D-alanine ligase [Zetaproteobacteria bacterium CG12_big_fil_rev_8_21_14_0_65_55_1124]|nr:MAG: D-alanine--D-alanine ligase [Zetaproteobacteria bacterium CG1_02_55_237]PIS19913.1 MAG: D-alanine--D-alanine ligase [Zetaproteobacteria bacterium CG08_land_8_20_14_0_20_55_17]PIW43664.1 MAG: D-alanine--D-alanine ligase [Zetaproteobacteria bacterium CG12_big_fil_rev_8_21_14_0_65_55_1124]PIY52667.1 MAG: D-alanine--D-alanine ligase [Zetaproteobacteria bacterium CG_4_10_14_0_8_um_filter_55_43]PIZ37851.1 MAG: D-alanine--D-alanine ligase [Zetaproteobacteria bacterium CG_4_10_14_0_2_um_filter_
MIGSRVGVLMGGVSSEREISLRSGKAVLAALQRCGIDAVGLDLGSDWVKQIQNADIHTAFIALHGCWGEDGCVQGLLEIMRIPYTGSGVTASGLCMDKDLCKAVLQRAGIKVPVDVPIRANGPLRYPVFIKPVAEGSSVGLHLLNNEQEWLALGITDSRGWMAEMPVRGVEIAVAVVGGEALPPVEVAPKSGVYDYTSKYTAGATDYFCPARLPAETLGLCMQRAEQAVRVTGCDGAPRVDMIVGDGGEPLVLEINTIPGMTETSLLPKSAAAAGMNFEALCLRMLQGASLKSTACMTGEGGEV